MGSVQQSVLYNTLRSFSLPYRITQDKRPDFLKNKKTQLNFEIDIYIPLLKIGFEYQGAVHFHDLKRFGNDSDKSRLNDFEKQNIVNEKKFVFIEIFECDLTGDIKENIVKRINNTADFEFQRGGYDKACKLSKLGLYIKYGINNITDITIKNGFSEEDVKQHGFYKKLKNLHKIYLFGSTKSINAIPLYAFYKNAAEYAFEFNLINYLPKIIRSELKLNLAYRHIERLKKENKIVPRGISG